MVDHPDERFSREGAVNTMTHRSDISEIDKFRESMIEELRRLGALRTVEVERAMRIVPRHEFLPETSMEDAYEVEYALVTKRDDRGVSVSSVSGARVHTMQLEQARIRPGDNVLEIGSGGCNAAYISELVGPAGRVTSVDIDPQVVERARRLLAPAGYGRVRTILADADGGAPDGAPYDRILVTVEAVDVAKAWVDQLAPDGLIVLPLRLRGLCWSVALRLRGANLVGDDFEVCGFVPMRGIGALEQDLVLLHDEPGREVGLRLDGAAVDADLARRAFHESPHHAWSAVTLAAGVSFSGLELWCVGHLPDLALLAATRAARDSGLVSSWSSRGTLTALQPHSGSFAYLTTRPTTKERTQFELGAVGHGPHGNQAADALIEQIHAWDRHRHQSPSLTARPVDAIRDASPDGIITRRRDHWFTVDWSVRA